MPRTLRIALVLSVAAHLAILLLRREGEPPVEGTLLSLDVRLDVDVGAATERLPAASPGEAVETPEAETLVDETLEEAPPEAPETLVAEATTPPPPAVQETAADAEPQAGAEPIPEPAQPTRETAPEPVARVARTTAGPQAITVPEPPVEAATELRTLAPPPTPASESVASRDQHLAPLVRPRVAFTEREQRMLDRKVAQWSATFHRLDPTEPTVTWQHRGQAYTATFKPLAAKDDRSIDELLIEIRKVTEGETLSTELRLRKLAFSNFAQFVDEWDPRVSLHDDEIGGRFHSNSEVNVAFDSRAGPVFHGKVTTSFSGINTDNAKGGMKRSDMFLGGLETGVRRISLPRELTLFPGDVEEDQVHYFEEDTRLAFYPDGTFGRQALESPKSETIVTIGEQSAYLIAGPKVALHVRGVVNGAVLVYSPSNIIVEDNLVYANDPEVDPESDDYLGLVSDRYVKIASAETTGDGDLVIHASIYAKRRFSVGRFRSRNDGTLDIFGSLSAGSISATEPRYRTRIRFDPRLADLRAPSFPMTDRYEVAAWNNLWVKR